METTSLNYYFITSDWKPSLDPLDSDHMHNSILLEQLVGTLVKFNGDGAYETYLAEEWQTSSDQLLWTFKLKKEFICLNKNALNAPKYVNQLLRNLKIYNKNKTPPVFSSLVGWSDFLKNDESKLGIKAIDSKTIQFQFSEKPNGFLEYLAMPYYGFYCDDDYDEQNNWKSISNITSTGAYELDSFKNGEVILKKKSDWFSHVNGSAERIKVKSIELNELSNIIASENTIIGLGKKIDEKHWPKGFEAIFGTPTSLSALVLNPKLHSFMNSNINRLILSSRIKGEIDKYNVLNKPIANGFYALGPEFEKNNVNIPKKFDLNIADKNKPIKVFIHGKKTDQRKINFEKLINSILSSTGLKIEFLNQEDLGYDLSRKLSSNNFVDIWDMGVIIGGDIQEWTIEMMFCSSLGVGFPDPTGRICQLTNDKKMNKIDSTHYNKEFVRILQEDAAVIPLSHFGDVWLISPKVDKSNLTPAMGLPRFDLIKIKP